VMPLSTFIESSDEPTRSAYPRDKLHGVRKWPTWGPDATCAIRCGRDHMLRSCIRGLRMIRYDFDSQSVVDFSSARLRRQGLLRQCEQEEHETHSLPSAGPHRYVVTEPTVLESGDPFTRETEMRLPFSAVRWQGHPPLSTDVRTRINFISDNVVAQSRVTTVSV
jgi:hypothetical protein